MVEAINTSENFLNEIRQIMYSLYRAKELLKKYIRYTENSKTSDPHRLLFNLSDKIDLLRIDTYVALSNLNIYFIWKSIKKYKNIKLKLFGGMRNNKLKIPDGSYSTLDIQDYFVYILKEQGELNDSSSIEYM